MMLGSFLPAMADGDIGDSGLDRSVDASLMPTRFVGMGASMLFGIPISIVRHTGKAYVDMTNKGADKFGGKMGGKDNGPTCGVVSIVTLPAAMVVGTVKGTYWGAKNSFTHFNQPFEGESFSTGKMEE